MPFFKRAKPRLQLALYARPKYPDTYHYALLISPDCSSSPASTPSKSTITKHHVKNTLQNTPGLLTQPWVYETTPITDISREPRLLACVIIVKLAVPVQRVNAIMQEIPVYQADDTSGRGQIFDCVEWVRLATEHLKAVGALSGTIFSWESIREESLRYVEGKKKQGWWQIGWTGGNAEDVATFDLLRSKEVVP